MINIFKLIVLIVSLILFEKTNSIVTSNKDDFSISGDALDNLINALSFSFNSNNNDSLEKRSMLTKNDQFIKKKLSSSFNLANNLVEKLNSLKSKLNESVNMDPSTTTTTLTTTLPTTSTTSRTPPTTSASSITPTSTTTSTTTTVSSSSSSRASTTVVSSVISSSSNSRTSTISSIILSTESEYYLESTTLTVTTSPDIGLIVGLSVFAVSIVAIAIGVSFFFYKKKKSNKIENIELNKTY